jgi:hypothetical protein
MTHAISAIVFFQLNCTALYPDKALFRDASHRDLPALSLYLIVVIVDFLY